ncbi:DUF3592 domain-containing protein [Rheinheimera sp.]|uniref:DUF3592 domain-containing protein n=1 Tax=Rheinheimera sp. TaxID=1869214 RepID=UPI0040478867
MRTLIYLLLALLFWGLCSLTLHNRLQFLTQAAATEGVIHDVKFSSGQKGRKTSRKTEVIIQFTTRSGQSIEQAVYRHQHTKTEDKGSRLEVLYNPDKPEQAAINEFRTLWFLPLLCGLIAVGFSVLCLRRLLPATSSNWQWLQNLRVACLVPAGLSFALALKVLLLR